MEVDLASLISRGLFIYVFTCAGVVFTGFGAFPSTVPPWQRNLRKRIIFLIVGTGILISSYYSNELLMNRSDEYGNLVSFFAAVTGTLFAIIMLIAAHRNKIPR